jgi:hypothetical protein
MIQNFLKKKPAAQDGFSGEFCQVFQELMPLLASSLACFLLGKFNGKVHFAHGSESLTSKGCIW